MATKPPTSIVVSDISILEWRKWEAPIFPTVPQQSEVFRTNDLSLKWEHEGLVPAHLKHRQERMFWN